MMELYNKVRQVPKEAKKPIEGGRLKGMTDINPMWRIKVLTEQFGVAGFGWYYEILEEKIIEGANDEKVAFVKINLHVKQGNEWSKPIQGTGGSMFVAKERSGLYTSDEAFKMALTDAISVACKALGVAADVYFEKDRSKYDLPKDGDKPTKITKAQAESIGEYAETLDKEGKIDLGKMLAFYEINSFSEMTTKQYSRALKQLEKAEKKGA